jgi:hypothetical protein
MSWDKLCAYVTQYTSLRVCTKKWRSIEFPEGIALVHYKMYTHILDRCIKQKT